MSNKTGKWLKCDVCGEPIYRKMNQIKNSSTGKFFCSNKCRNKWFKEEYTQTEEWRNQRRRIAVETSSAVSKVDTQPQQSICSYLDNNKINHIKEKGFIYYSVDLFLEEYNIPIEIMGTFWHCDHRRYNIIEYNRQVDRIIRDKAKNTYISKEYNMKILYLWEEDITNNIELCHLLINKYINDGFLDNYHSFNYCVVNNELVLKDEIELSYMQMDISEVNNITTIKVKRHRSMRQDDKWITFKCDYCGKEKEELISHYNKKKHHFCSQKCRGEYDHEKNSTEVVCANCGKKFFKKNCDIKRSKSKIFCCCRNCNTKYRNKGGLNTFCYTCGKPIYLKPSQIKRSKTHHCSLSCASKYGQIVKDEKKNLKEK